MSSIFQTSGKVEGEFSEPISSTPSTFIVFGNPIDIITSGSKTFISSITIQGVPSNQSADVAILSAPPDIDACWAIIINTKSWSNTSNTSSTLTIHKAVNSTDWFLIYGTMSQQDQTLLKCLNISPDPQTSKITFSQIASTTNDGDTFHSIKYEFSSGNMPLINPPIFI
jgi:hypothetical protein